MTSRSTRAGSCSTTSGRNRQGFRIYEINLDGTNLRQITTPPADEDQRIATYAMCSQEDLAKNPCRYGHWTDDMHPCYLPDGRIAFTSTRSERSVLCGGHSLTVTNLYRINPDGTRLHQLSQGALSEFCPSVMNDGRILYNRWEYVDKGAGAVQSLWAMCPDGSRSEEIYGNNITTPGVFNQAHNVPGRNNLVVCLGAGHAPGNIGAIMLVDMLKDKRSEGAMTALTPGCIPKGNWGMRQFRNDHWITDIHGPWYCDPYPLSSPTDREIAGKFFLVSCNPEGEWNDPTAYGIYLLDVFGNRVLIHDEPDSSCWQARPIEPRPVPPILSDAPAPQTVAESEPATILLSDVYQGLDGVPRGSVKYLRIMEQVPRPWSVYIGYQPDDSVARPDGGHQPVHASERQGTARRGPGAGGRIGVFHRSRGSQHLPAGAGRGLHGDSAHADVCEFPAGRAALVHRLSRAAQPGARRIGGCWRSTARRPRPRHSRAKSRRGRCTTRPTCSRSSTDTASPATVPTNPDGDLDLTGTMTSLFNRSYENMIARDLVGYIQEFIGPKPEGADAMGYAPAVPPYTYGSHRSKLIQLLRQGHYEVQLSREELIALTTWVDSNAPYYGSYFGRRNLSHREGPDFRPVPTLESALGIRALE